MKTIEDLKTKVIEDFKKHLPLYFKNEQYCFKLEDGLHKNDLVEELIEYSPPDITLDTTSVERFLRDNVVAHFIDDFDIITEKEYNKIKNKYNSLIALKKIK